MNTVSVEVPFVYRAQIIKPRCRKPVEIFIRDVVQVKIKCLGSAEAPVAFRVGEQNTHAFADRLWQQSFHTVHGEEPVLVTLEKVLELSKDSSSYPYSSSSAIAPFFNVWHGVKADWDKSWSHPQPWLKDEDVLPLEEYVYRVMVESNREETVEYIQKVAASMISVDRVMFEPAGEPRYCFMTFGLGNNHGGSSLFVSTHYNCNVPHRCYFSATEREKAIAFALDGAQGRGDNQSIEHIKNTEMIEVLMPEMVKVNPALDHPVE